MTSSRRLRLSTLARADLRGLLQHSVSTWGDRQQDAYAQAIDAAIREIASFPSLGRARDDLFPGCRSHAVRQHVIFYHADRRTVTIDRILRVRMDAAQVDEQHDTE